MFCGGQRGLVHHIVAVIALALCVASNVQGQEGEQIIALVKSNLQRMDAVNLDSEWLFTLTTQLDDELLVVRNNPGTDEAGHRQLLSVDGQTPTPGRLKKFRKQEVKRLEEELERGGPTKYCQLVDLSTLALLEQSNTHATLSFTPDIKALTKNREQLQGKIVLNTETKLVEQIHFENTEKLSPAFSVSLNLYQMTLSFSQQQGQLLLHNMTSKLAGKAGFFKTFESQVKVDFSDYQYSGVENANQEKPL